MAFFGLTTLGSQSPFEVAQDTPLSVFEPSDWQRAFMETVQPGFSLHSESDEEVAAARRLLETATLPWDALPALLRALYKCPRGVDNVPPRATQQAAACFATADATAATTMSLRECLSIAERVRARAEQDETAVQRGAYAKDGAASREFVSGGEFRGALVKHTRMARDPAGKQRAPLTDAQTLGWLKPTSVVARRPTKSCEETKFASAMVKAGVYYY